MAMVRNSLRLITLVAALTIAVPLTTSTAQAQCKSKSCQTKTKFSGKTAKKTVKPKVAKTVKTAKTKSIKKTAGTSTNAKPRNVIWAPGAQKTPFGGIAKGAKKTSFGVMKGQRTSFGVIAPGAKTTSFGVLNGQQRSFGVTATGAQKTTSGFMGAGCKKTAFGVKCSDIRLKRDIVALGRLDNGIGLYRFRYLWSNQAYVGVMAQDVEHIVPAAVMRNRDGYLRVDYHRLGLRMQTWDEWTAQH